MNQQYIPIVELDAQGQITKQNVVKVEDFTTAIKNSVIAQLPKEAPPEPIDRNVAWYIGNGIAILVVVLLAVTIFTAIWERYKEVKNKI